MRVLHALEAGKSIGQAVRWLRFVYSKEDGWTRRKVASVLLLSAISARADQTWLGSADNQWTNANNWSGHAVPTAADTVIFNSPTAGSLSSNWLAKPFSIVGLIYSNQLQIPPPITIGGSSLTIGTGGIDISKTFDIGLTNNEPVVLNGSQTWLPGGSRIVMNNVVSGSGNITVQGLQGGSTLLGASNTFAGTVEIANGTTLYCKHPAALGTNGITVAAGTATLYFRSGADTAPIRTPFTIAGPSSPFGGLHVGDGIGVTIESDITCTSNPWINADSNSFYIIKGNIFATNTVTFALLGSATNSISGAFNWACFEKTDTEVLRGIS